MLNRVGRVLLSTGLVTVSAAYAIWQHRQQIEAPIASPLTPPDRPNPPPSQGTQSLSQPVPAMGAPSQSVSQAAVPPPAPAAPQDSVAAPAPFVSAENQAPVQTVPDAAAPPPVADNPPAPPPPVPARRYADGQFIGDSIDTEWGDVQVEATIRNGVLADVTCIAYPNHRRRSQEISNWAIPMLRQEAIEVQSADIDIVSQASFTSDGYRQSLASALVKARN